MKSIAIVHRNVKKYLRKRNRKVCVGSDVVVPIWGAHFGCASVVLLFAITKRNFFHGKFVRRAIFLAAPVLFIRDFNSDFRFDGDSRWDA
jgi:hypothetical protein